MAKKAKKSSNIAETEAVQSRTALAQKLELERMEVKREMEKLMAEYAKATGIKKYAKRKYKVGKAPNDYKAPSVK